MGDATALSLPNYSPADLVPTVEYAISKTDFERFAKVTWNRFLVVCQAGKKDRQHVYCAPCDLLTKANHGIGFLLAIVVGKVILA
jgi:hypothetical protein